MIRWIVLALALAALGVLSFFGLWLYTGHQSAPGLARADFVLVEKSRHRMTLMYGGEPIRSYSVSLGRGGSDPKQREGDGRTPEGRYVIDWRNPSSKFHLSLHVSYPNAHDRQNARRLGAAPGGSIMIHGTPNGWEWAGPFINLVDWTDGCVAVSNAEMEEIWKAVPDGTPIEIRP